MLTRMLNHYIRRTFTRSVIKNNLEKPKVPETTTQQPTNTSNPYAGLDDSCVPSGYEKKILVWFGKYKSVNDIPPTVSIISLNHAKSVMRVKVGIVIMGLMLLSCYVIVRVGKYRASKGENYVHTERSRVEKIKEQGRLETLQAQENKN